MYFNKFPKLTYTFPNKNPIELVDIFRKVSISESSREDAALFTSTLLTQGEKPEVVAGTVYSNTELSWLVFLANNIVNPHNEWPTEHTKFIELTRTKNPGNSYFITNLPELKKGDIAVFSNSAGTGLDFGRYTEIKLWDTSFRYFLGIGGAGTISTGDYCVFFRLNDQGTFIQIPGTGVSLIRKKADYVNSVVNFYTDDSIVNPYTIVNGGSLTNLYASPVATSFAAATPDYTDTTTIINTVLFKYMTGDNIPCSVDTLLNQKIKENYKYSNIKILKNEVHLAVVDLFQNALDNEDLGRSLQIQFTLS